jgi:diguanylate cyclase (GGDEF)-like protein
MAVEPERRRVLIAAAPAERAPLVELFARDRVEGWEAGEAESFEQARFLLQHDPCDVLLVDHSLYRPEDVDGLGWLSRQAQAPVAYLAGPDPAALTAVLERGASQWLPRDLALSHPALLAAVLNQAASKGDLRRGTRRLGEALQECRRQVRGLVTLLWGLSPTEAHPRWFTQRHMMERLQEEIARTQRHGSPLSVVLGEVQTGETLLPPDAPQVTAWTAERVTRCKRRTDVAGHYGPSGFILLLAHTPQPGAAVCCRRLRGALEDGPGAAPAPPAPIAAFFGISTYDADHANAKSLLGRAEECLERARGEGNGHVVF